MGAWGKSEEPSLGVLSDCSGTNTVEQYTVISKSRNVVQDKGYVSEEGSFVAAS
jgi:hypothetical protein